MKLTPDQFNTKIPSHNRTAAIDSVVEEVQPRTESAEEKCKDDVLSNEIKRTVNPDVELPEINPSRNLEDLTSRTPLTNNGDNKKSPTPKTNNSENKATSTREMRRQRLKKQYERNFRL